jgi:hypothetical protein
LGRVKSRASRRSGKNSYETVPLPEHEIAGGGGAEQGRKEKVR